MHSSQTRLRTSTSRAAVKKINDKYAKELERMKKDEEEAKLQQIEEIKNKVQEG